MKLMNALFGFRSSSADTAFDEAMNVSDDLIKHMQETSQSRDAVRAVMADVWAQRNNIAFMTTTFEAVQEAKAPIEQRSEDE